MFNCGGGVNLGGIIMTREDAERANEIIDMIDMINSFLKSLEGENISLFFTVENDSDFNRIYSENFLSKDSKKSWLIEGAKRMLKYKKCLLEKALEAL